MRSVRRSRRCSHRPRTGGTVSYRDRELQSVQVQGVTSEYQSILELRRRARPPDERASKSIANQSVALLGWDVGGSALRRAQPAGEDDHHLGHAVPSRRRERAERQHLRQFAGRLRRHSARRYTRIFGTPPVAVADGEADVAGGPARRPSTTRRWRCAYPGGSSRRDRDNFGIFTSDTVIGIYEQATNGIFAVLVGVVALSLLVGGIVIMNIMLMAVSERTREIGLRKALGAKRRDIMSQFLTESVTLSSLRRHRRHRARLRRPRRLIAYFSPLPATLEPWSVVLGIGITAGVGLFFGAYPAARAASLDPIEALRRE